MICSDTKTWLNDRIWLLDKPQGITSRKMLNQVAKKLKQRKLGHSGTLDPLATGLLLVLSGQARKIQDIFTCLDKRYRATVQLGAFSQTDDEEGPIIQCNVATIPDISQVKRAIRAFTGVITQIPSAYSAVKIKGKPAYKLARQGKQVDMPAREVTLYSLVLREYCYPFLELDIHCSCGLYVRTLARDIGTMLGTGGYIKNLRRTAVGSFQIEQAKELQYFCNSCSISLEEALKPFAKVRLDRSYLYRVINGQRFSCKNHKDGEVFIWIDNRVISRGKVENHVLHPKKLLISHDENLPKITSIL